MMLSQALSRGSFTMLVHVSIFDESSDFLSFKKLRTAVNCAASKADLVRSCTGGFHSNSAHTLYSMKPDTLADAGRYPVSSFAASLCAQECKEDVIVALASRLNKSSNPSVDGHLFE
jgi:hypothetical protein